MTIVLTSIVLTWSQQADVRVEDDGDGIIHHTLAEDEGVQVRIDVQVLQDGKNSHCNQAARG